MPRQRAIIIGASSGIGEALARRLAQEGYTLALLARRAERLENLCGEINREVGEARAVPYVHDVTQYETVADLLHRIVAELGGLDLVVYTAGANYPPGLETYDFEHDHQMIEVNLLGAMAWFSQVAPLFQSMRGGQIVAISSVAGERGRVGNPGYNTSKAGLTCYLEALRNRLTRHGVYVLTVKPGFVKTEMLAAAQRVLFPISADRAAADIWSAIRRRKQEIYTPARWRVVMLIIRNIPSVLFRRMSF
jgi:decaprenylphospho-beta-D-erythro-pentofuranosid-2-ulose 2-reductase